MRGSEDFHMIFITRNYLLQHIPFHFCLLLSYVGSCDGIVKGRYNGKYRGLNEENGAEHPKKEYRELER